MHKPLPPLNALRAFEAAARHLSLTKAATELHVTAGALSHQIRALEEMLGVKLFERRVRAIALTPAGKRIYPGLQVGFTHIQDAIAGLSVSLGVTTLAVSTPPGFTSKWLAPRLHRFLSAYPKIDTRVSSSMEMVNLAAGEIDVAVRNLRVDAPSDPGLVTEKLLEVSFLPVCSPTLIETLGPFTAPGAFKGVPLIHDDSFAGSAGTPTWNDWFKEAGLDSVDVSRGLRFNSADHALDAAIEGAGVLLAPDALAYDELRTGRLAVAVEFFLRSGRAYYFVCMKGREDQGNVNAFRTWIKQEAALVDWSSVTKRLPSN